MAGEATMFEQRAIEAGVRAPRLLLSPEGDAVITVAERHFRAHDWIDNARPCSDRPVTAALAASVARNLATMHSLQIRPSRYDVFPTPTTATCDGWPDLVGQLHRSGSPYAMAAESLSPDVARIRDWFTRRPAADEGRVMSHGDIDQKNLLLVGGAAWLVDWDVAAPWVPAEEAVRTAMSLACWRRPAVARAFSAAYESAGGMTIEPDGTLLAHDLRISLDWLDRCLRIAAGILPATPQRRAEARQQAQTELRTILARIAITANLPAWLSSAGPSGI